MAFKKRKYGAYDGFSLPKNVSSGALKRLQTAIGAGVFTKVTKDVETAPDVSVAPAQETPATGGEEEVSQT